MKIGVPIEAAEYFGLSKADADRISAEIIRMIQENWFKIAQGHGLSSGAMVFR